MKFTVTDLPPDAPGVVTNARRARGPVCALRLAWHALGQPLASDFTDSAY
jgi:hypothetical protein